jgi:hypothetical protein
LHRLLTSNLPALTTIPPKPTGENTVDNKENADNTHSSITRSNRKKNKNDFLMTITNSSYLLSSAIDWRQQDNYSNNNDGKPKSHGISSKSFHQPVGSKYNKNDDSSSKCKQGLEHLSISIPKKSFPSSFNPTKHGLENTQNNLQTLVNLTLQHYTLNKNVNVLYINKLRNVRSINCNNLQLFIGNRYNQSILIVIHTLVHPYLTLTSLCTVHTLFFVVVTVFFFNIMPQRGFFLAITDSLSSLFASKNPSH